MLYLIKIFGFLLMTAFLFSCGPGNNNKQAVENEKGDLTNDSSSTRVIKPVLVTDTVNYDSDDPAIWINENDYTSSIILGTDKMEEKGGIVAFNLDGKIIKSIDSIDRPNNIDIAYDFVLNGDTIDIAVFTERMSSTIRVISVPDMELIDNGGIPVFEESEYKQPMGVALYTRPSDKKIFAIVSRKENPGNANDYLWQYELEDSGNSVTGKLVRKFGVYESDEVEAIAVDNELGYVYYSDEGYGIRKYYADPSLNNNKELAVFGLDGFIKDREGISIYKTNEKEGYILVSDQGANEFHIFPREGSEGNAHDHPLIKVVKLSTLDSDGSEVTSLSLNSKFPKGLFVAMSTDKTFHYYSWEDIIEN